MKIYTKTGDDGTTGLLGGGRLPKDASRIEAYGTVDELNAAIGVARAALAADADLDAALGRIQEDLFALGAELAAEAGRVRGPGEGVPPGAIARLEGEIDRWEAELEPLRNFILPGGSPAAASLHLTRTVCRRAERRAVTLAGAGGVSSSATVYLNRLSDHLFVAARVANRRAGHADVPWRPRGPS